MKRIMSIVLYAVMILAMSACNAADNGTDSEYGFVSQTSSIESTSLEQQDTVSAAESESSEQSTQEIEKSKILIAYFSRVGNTEFPENVDAVSSASLNLQNGELMGNTEVIASLIRQEVGGDMFRIETQKKYPADYDELVDYGRSEPNEDNRPVLSSHVENMDDYSVIFLGFPNWWFDMPMAVYSFLEEYDFNGKTIIPFCTHGGSRFSDTISTLRETLESSTVLDGFEVHGEKATEAHDNIAAWIKTLDITAR